MATLILKRPVKYGKITLISQYPKEGWYIFTGLNKHNR